MSHANLHVFNVRRQSNIQSLTSTNPVATASKRDLSLGKPSACSRVASASALITSLFGDPVMERQVMMAVAGLTMTHGNSYLLRYYQGYRLLGFQLDIHTKPRPAHTGRMVPDANRSGKRQAPGRFLRCLGFWANQRLPSTSINFQFSHKATLWALAQGRDLFPRLGNWMVPERFGQGSHVHKDRQGSFPGQF